MDTDFKHHSTRSFDISDVDTENSMSVSQIPLPDELPAKTDWSQLPKEILKSSTVENLISQNEDLMARLKVSLRRLSLLEMENQELAEEAAQARLSQSSVSDQILIWREKDSMWKQKVDHIEKERDLHLEKSRALQEKVRTMTSELSRHVKYHERIKNQVKPYISDLKAYSRTQELKIQSLESYAEHREAQLRDLRHQIIEVTKNSRYQVEASEKKAQELVQYYESQVENLQRQLVQLQQIQEDLEIKSLKLHKSLEQQDLLENEVVALRRSKEEMKTRFDRDLQKQSERLQELTRHNQKLGVEHADLQIRVVEDTAKIEKMERENFQLQEQLESLRFMWAAKNEENEKLKAAAAALERLNLELSQKLNEIRKTE